MCRWLYSPSVQEITKIGVHPSITAFEPEALQEELSNIDTDVTVLPDEPESIGDCDALVTLEHREGFFRGDRPLHWVHLSSAGVDHFPVEKYADAEIPVTNSSGIHSACMAENALGLMISHAHRLPQFHEAQNRHEWRRDLAWAEKFTVNDQPVCVVGLGAIGRQVAAYADVIGMQVTGVKRTPESIPHVDHVYPAEDLHAAIEEARFVVLCVPLSEATRHLMSTPEFETMRSDAMLVNISRGSVVDEPALIQALESDELAGAALDVFEEEPLPAESPLWEMDDVIVTPHVSGAFQSYYKKVAELVRTNIQRTGTDEPLENRVV